MSSGLIPVLHEQGKSLPEAWERAVLSLWDNGTEIRTEYDRKDNDGNFIDPPSRDCSMTFTVLHPQSEPRFHKCFPGGPADLQEYRMEVLQGIKDHWVDLGDKKKWQYTYHERLTDYTLVTENVGQPFVIDQIQKMIGHLAKSPYTRRCQAITWQPWHDMDSSEPPCLQRIWCRILFDDKGEWYLNMNVSFRSRDGYMAAFMNADAFIQLMQYIADEVGKIAGREVHLGRYSDHSDSFHIYGKDMERFKNEFLHGLKHRTFAERTFLSEDLMPMLLEAIPVIEEKVRKQDAGE